MSAVLLAPTAILVSATFTDANPTLLSLATAIGLLAALVQSIRLIRWPFAVPHLARKMSNPTSTASTKDMVDVTFQTLNRYLGVAVGGHLGYMFTGFWPALVGAIVLQWGFLHPAFGIVGLILAPCFLVGFDGVRRKQREGRLEVRGDFSTDGVHPMVAVVAGLQHPAIGAVMTWHPRQLGPQTGLTIPVTGANSGTGIRSFAGGHSLGGEQ